MDTVSEEEEGALSAYGSQLPLNIRTLRSSDRTLQAINSVLLYIIWLMNSNTHNHKCNIQVYITKIMFTNLSVQTFGFIYHTNTKYDYN